MLATQSQVSSLSASSFPTDHKHFGRRGKLVFQLHVTNSSLPHYSQQGHQQQPHEDWFKKKKDQEGDLRAEGDGRAGEKRDLGEVGTARANEATDGLDAAAVAEPGAPRRSASSTSVPE